MDILKGSVTTIALFLTYVTIPLLGIVGGVFAPLPGIIYTLKSGKVAGFVIVLTTTIVLGLVSDISAVIVYIVQCATVSLFLPLFFAGRSTAKAIVYTSTAGFAALSIAAATLIAASGINIDSEVMKWLDLSIAQTSTVYSKAGIKGEELQLIQQTLKQVMTLLGQIYPSLLVIVQVVVVIINVSALSAYAKRRGLQIDLDDFKKFRNPDQLIWVVILAGFATLPDNDVITRAAANVLMVGLFAYFVQGMAIMSHFFSRYLVPKMGRFFFYMFLFIQPYLAIGPVLLGIFDLWVNFRLPKDMAKDL